jgi:hypothetical protein
MHERGKKRDGGSAARSLGNLSHPLLLFPSSLSLSLSLSLSFSVPVRSSEVVTIDLAGPQGVVVLAVVATPPPPPLYPFFPLFAVRHRNTFGTWRFAVCALQSRLTVVVARLMH